MLQKMQIGITIEGQKDTVLKKIEEFSLVLRETNALFWLKDFVVDMQICYYY